MLGNAGLAGAALVRAHVAATLLLPAVLALRGFQAVPWVAAGLRVLLPRRAA